MFVNEDLHNTQKAKCRKTCTGLIHNNFWRVKEEKLGGALIVGVTFFFTRSEENWTKYLHFFILRFGLRGVLTYYFLVFCLCLKCFRTIFLF